MCSSDLVRCDKAQIGTLFHQRRSFSAQTSPIHCSSTAIGLRRRKSCLRSGQFPEDAGPMAHPIRPDSFVTIDNFYTMTVYEKGSEVVRMLQTIFGREGFRKGTDLYFDRHDGQAVTCDDFVAAIFDANAEPNNTLPKIQC
mgnify:CR=1 FL=1